MAGYVACSLVTYGCNLSKPRSVSTVTVLSAALSELPRAIDLGSRDGAYTYEWIAVYYDMCTEGSPVWNWEVFSADGRVRFFVTALLGLCFGAIHLAAWNFVFPNLLEMWVWRGAALLSAAILPIGYLIILAWYWSWGSELFIQILTLVSYCVARMVLIFMMFRSLLFLPPEAFKATPAINIPHIG